LYSSTVLRSKTVRSGFLSEYHIPVSIPGRSYTIEIAPGLLTSSRAVQVLAELVGTSRVCFVTHPGLKIYTLPLIEALEKHGIASSLHLVPPGEHRKSLSTVAKMYTAFLEARLDRKSLVVAVGGGVLGDMVGFAAASYLRGIRFVQVPTTLLAQVDSSVGGKTGVDLPEGKNLVGAFHQPSSVLIDPLTLKTLPARELRAGLAEVIKYGIIYDEPFFQRIDSLLPALLRREVEPLAEVVARSCEIKAEVVMQDETEQGLRAILNFGHTIGHALESVTRYRRYKHGEAISIGMVAEARIGEIMGQTPPAVTTAIRECFLRAKLPVDFPVDVSIESLLGVAQRDKKTIGGLLRFLVPTRMGEVTLRSDIPESVIYTACGR
jgi:3-dehydroquinate synthase